MLDGVRCLAVNAPLLHLSKVEYVYWRSGKNRGGG